MDSLRIVTLNTGKCDGPYRSRIEWLIEEGKRLSPDVLALQECFRDESGALDTADRVAKALKMSCAWAPARFKRRDCEGAEVWGWSGMALLSVRPWAYVDAIELPMDDRDGDRVAQVGLLDLDRVSVVIANVHLTHLRDADDLRKRQLASVLDHPLMRMKQAMRLVAGDFNSRPQSALLRELRDDEALGDVRDTFTFGSEEPRPSTLVRHEACVDYILSVATQADAHPLFTSPAVVFKTPHPVTGILPSDHYGVATTLVPTRMHGWLRQESSLVG